MYILQGTAYKGPFSDFGLENYVNFIIMQNNDFGVCLSCLVNFIVDITKITIGCTKLFYCELNL